MPFQNPTDNKVYLSWPPDGDVCAAVHHGIADVSFKGNKWGQQSS